MRIFVQDEFAKAYWRYNVWNQVCKEVNGNGYCVEFYPPEKSWDQDIIYHFSTLGTVLVIFSIFTGAGFYVGYEFTTSMYKTEDKSNIE